MGRGARSMSGTCSLADRRILQFSYPQFKLRGLALARARARKSELAITRRYAAVLTGGGSELRDAPPGGHSTLSINRNTVGLRLAPVTGGRSKSLPVCGLAYRRISHAQNFSSRMIVGEGDCHAQRRLQTRGGSSQGIKEQDRDRSRRIGRGYFTARIYADRYERRDGGQRSPGRHGGGCGSIRSSSRVAKAARRAGDRG